ncbi:MarR family winged helix-turn-helix transcriptional regulator [Streptomyces sp. MS19]|uniref:MarR family winged helix-turn-helix transcriptional regulator n=1 Tax=Streptomyces sp. MS19 TaxID=3385972 RepID=UPI0039A1E876
MPVTQYTEAELAAQPVGYWATEASRLVLAAIRAELAAEDLTQPHWWTLNHVSGAPGTWTRAALTERLAPFDQQDSDFPAMLDDLVARRWLTERDGLLALAPDGEAGLSRARERVGRAHAALRDGIPDAAYAAMIDTLRRIVGNLGGDSDLP